jgi:DNA-nicking Smr family endonuclease
VDSLDLHGFSVREAEARVSQFIPGIAKTHPGAIVEIVTGRGRHSREEPVLRDVVKSLLKGRLSKHVREFALSVDGGAYRVRLS